MVHWAYPKTGRLSRRWLTLVGALLGASGLFIAADAFSADGKVHPQLWAAGPRKLLIRPEVEQFVNDLLSRLSLEEKIGQMIQADIEFITPEQLRAYRLGSVLAGGSAAPHGQVRCAPRAWLEMTDAYHRASLAPGTGTHPPIPILFGIDAVHGNGKVRGATIFPHNIGLGAAGAPELIRRIGEATAEEVSVTGIDWTFAPTVAVARDVRWGRSYESYSEDPQLVSRYASAFVTGLQGELATPQFMAPGHTVSSVKHFLGDGGTLDGRDQGDTEISEAGLSRIHGAGYVAAIDAGAMVVMASYNGWQGIKLHANHGLLTDVLKRRLGFNGFVVGDWNAQEEIPGCTKFSCPQAINAGIDMIMAPDSWQQFYENTLAQVRSGQIAQSRIDDAVRRILRVKALAGMFSRPAPAQRPLAGHFERLGSAEHRALAREAVRKSLVLLKNNGHILPLSPAARILVAGTAADDIGTQVGGWSVDWQGDHNTNEDFPGATSILAGIRAAVARGGGKVIYSIDGASAERADAAIVVFGESPYAEFEGDRETVEYSPGDKSALALLKRLKARGIPVVAVFLSGRPMWVNPELNAADAFVAAWLPGTEGAGIADVLFRGGQSAAAGEDFSGRLSFSWPATAMPVRFDADDRPHGVLFARGYGLTYADQGTLSKLPEDPRVPADRGTPDTLFSHAHVTAPWSIFVADHLAQVRLTMQSQASPAGALAVQLTPAGATIQWAGGQGGQWRISGRPENLLPRVAHHEALELRVRVKRPPTQAVRIGVQCVKPYERMPPPSTTAAASPEHWALCGTVNGATLDLTQQLSASPGQWRTLLIPLTCLAERGANLTNVESPILIQTKGALALTLADARFVPAPAGANCSGN